MNDIFNSLRRTPYQTFAAISILFFTLLMSGLIFISLSFIQGLLGYVETRPRIIVYFQIKAEEKEITAIRDELEKSGKTKEVTYVSKGGNSIKGYWVGKIIRIDINLKGEEI